MTVWRERIRVDPQVCHGAACIRGTRVPVSAILDNLAAGYTADQIVHSYPTITLDDDAAAAQWSSVMDRA